jgi:hypothetical protein
MTDKEAMAMALDALIEAQTNDDSMEKWDRNKKAITALKERLADPMREVQRLGQEIEQEPVAVYGYCPECGAKGVQRERRPNGNDKCANGHTYPSSKATTPPQRTWIGLTEQQRNDIEDACEMIIGKPAFDAVEAKLKQKNGYAEEKNT